VGGLLFLLGGLIAAYNIYRTISASGAEIQAGDLPISVDQIVQAE
jgi:cbb3-type cytochrome oxidase subunit 1